MREPAFWWRSPSWMSRLWSPLGIVYGAITGHRMRQAGHRAAVPVICVGNYSLGGAGKTPAAIALVKLLQGQGESPVVVSRGYGGSKAGPVRVDPVAHTAADVGDEPLLLARAAPVIVSQDRVAGAAAACEAGASVIVMDDGFQNPSLHKDLALVVIDGARGVGNGCVFPSGPLRAPLATQIARTDGLVVVGEGRAAAGIAGQVSAKGGLVLRAQVVADPQTVAALAGKRVLAFAGIGDPQRFFATLRSCGIDVAIERAFADHHPFTRADVTALIGEARSASLTLVTTEKDLVRLPGPDAGMVEPFPITLAFDDEENLRALTTARLKQARAEIGVQAQSAGRPH